MGRVARQHILDPTTQLPLRHHRRRVQLHHKGTLHGQRSVGGWVARYRPSSGISDLDLCTALYTPLLRSTQQIFHQSRLQRDKRSLSTSVFFVQILQ
jgi:hypothetical protein